MVFIDGEVGARIIMILIYVMKVLWMYSRIKMVTGEGRCWAIDI